MSNILNHNRKNIEFSLIKEDYWDFHLAIDKSTQILADGLTERCLSSYIDLSEGECVWFDDVYSKSKYVWESAINDNTLEFGNFGYTSVDNGKTHYEKDRISNKEFLDIFLNTTYKPQENDLRLTLSKVKGNQQLYDYSNDITFWNEKFQVSKLNGGWYQGFFCGDKGKHYKTLPTDINNGWSIEFVLNKEDFENNKETLNKKYVENKGIFFYIGTRAENKWWEKYLNNHDFDWCQKNGFADDYVNEEYSKIDSLNANYFKPFADTYDSEGTFDKDYINQDENLFGKSCKNYVDDEYYEKEVVIDKDMKLETEDGYDVSQPNIEEFTTDNKFLIFDRTSDGVTIDKWDENAEYVFNYIKKPNIGNYFTLFNRTCKGYDVNKIQDLINMQNKEYNVLSDLYRNALALQIKDDGTIGYKFLIRDCDSEVENYKIEQEFTKKTVINEKQWYTVHVKIIPIRHKIKEYPLCLRKNSVDDKMKIIIYVNGSLVLVSKDLPMLNLKQLNDLDSKQQGVPFNISIGGGTQGLAEVVYLNYQTPTEYTLPLEKEFGGSFVGWLKSFRFYTCPLTFEEIVKNYQFEKQNF